MRSMKYVLVLCLVALWKDKGLICSLYPDRLLHTKLISTTEDNVRLRGYERSNCVCVCVCVFVMYSTVELSKYRYSLECYGPSALSSLFPQLFFAPYILLALIQTYRSGHPSSYLHNSNLPFSAHDRPCIRPRVIPTDKSVEVSLNSRLYQI